MAKLVNLKIGDIFEVIISDEEKMYFQYISNDSLQLNSNVIRVFKKRYLSNESPTFNSIVQDEVFFCVHVLLHKGVKEGLWRRIGNNPEIGIIGNITFKTLFSDFHRWNVHNLYGEWSYYYNLPNNLEMAYEGTLWQPKNVYQMIVQGPLSIHPNFYIMREELYNEKECTERFGPWPHLGKL